MENTLNCVKSLKNQPLFRPVRTVAHSENLPETSQNINWLISCAHTVQPMNLAWKRQHEDVDS
jgi:hypothetical protein